MLVTLSGIVMLVKLVQWENACDSMLVTLFGIVMLAKFLQSENALDPMLVTLSGIFTLFKLEQHENASDSILVTLSGIVILIKLEQEENAWDSMLVTLSGIVMFFKLEQAENASFSILVMLFGMVTLFNFEQSKNAPFPMSVTPSLIITFVMSTPHGCGERVLYSPIFPLPLMVSSVPLSVQVQSPVVPRFDTKPPLHATKVINAEIIKINTSNRFISYLQIFTICANRNGVILPPF